MYLDEHAYPNAQRILSCSITPDDKWLKAIEQAKQDFPCEDWDEFKLSSMWADDANNLKSLSSQLKTTKIQPEGALWIALWDYPEGFHLSYEPEVSPGPKASWPTELVETGASFESNVFTELLDFSDVFEATDAAIAPNATEVVEMFLSLVYHALCFEQAISTLKNKSNFTACSIFIGHPDTGCGIRLALSA